MRIVVTAFFLLNSISLGFGGSPPALHVDSEGKYKVAFPSKPTLEVMKGGAGVPTHSAVVQGKAGAVMVVYYDVPTAIPKTVEAIQKMVFEEVRGVFVLGKGEMKSHKHVTFQKDHRALEFTGVVTGLADIPLEVRGRTVLVGKRFYNVVIMGTPAYLKSEEAVRFFESFEVTASAIDKDWRSLQGVWKTSEDSTSSIHLMILDKQIFYKAERKANRTRLAYREVGNEMPGEIMESDGKKLLDIKIDGKPYRKINYQFTKDGIQIEIPAFDVMPLRRINSNTATSKAAKTLAGTWVVLEVNHAGKKMTPVDAGVEIIAFEGDRYLMLAGGKEIQNSFYSIDDSKSPNTIDLYGKEVYHRIPAIFDVKDDELRVCYLDFVGRTPTERPNTFEPKGTVIIRAKKMAKMKTVGAE